MPFCFPYSIPPIRNSLKPSCASNATEPASGAKRFRHRFTDSVGRSVGSGMITVPASPVFFLLQMILSPFTHSSETWKGFLKIGDDSYHSTLEKVRQRRDIASVVSIVECATLERASRRRDMSSVVSIVECAVHRPHTPQY